MICIWNAWICTYYLSQPLFHNSLPSSTLIEPVGSTTVRSFLSMDDSSMDSFFTPLKLLIVALIVTIWSVKTFWSWEIHNIVSSLCSSGTKKLTFVTMLMDDLLFSKMSSLTNFLLTENFFYFHTGFLCLVSTKFFTPVHCKPHCPLSIRFWC